MGQKRKTRPSTDTLLDAISRMLVPSYILDNFEIYGANEYPNCWIIELREKESIIPVELKGCTEVVFDGYCNPIETRL
jgi:hypothetical protein